MPEVIPLRHGLTAIYHTRADRLARQCGRPTKYGRPCSLVSPRGYGPCQLHEGGDE